MEGGGKGRDCSRGKTNRQTGLFDKQSPGQTQIKEKTIRFLLKKKPIRPKKMICFLGTTASVKLSLQ